MASMDYCKFQNTLQDLQNCYDDMDNAHLSEDERKARKRLIILCQDIIDGFGDEIDAAD